MGQRPGEQRNGLFYRSGTGRSGADHRKRKTIDRGGGCDYLCGIFSQSAGACRGKADCRDLQQCGNDAPGGDQGKQVARVHTGDPSIYGAHREQMVRLDELGIAYEVVPGVSSFLATAAVLKREYTLPEVSQTVILTRMEGRTPVPEREKIEALASHQATMVIFLSVGQLDQLVGRLIEGGYPEETPVAVVYKASWPDQKIVRGMLTDIDAKVKEAGIRKTALVVVGRFLGDDFALSKLYDENFTHEFREAKKHDGEQHDGK